jgi:peptidoglycan hydrolase CwlO-like protein
MSDMKDKIKRLLLESKLYKDFSNLTNGILKKQDASVEALERANKIIEDEVEELAEQVHELMKS